MSKHTETPWKAFNNAGRRLRSYSQTSGVVSTTDDGIKLICGCFSDIGGERAAAANAAHIVRCVNAHDALVGALELLLSACEAVNEGYYPQGAIDTARAALALARGER